MRDLSPRPSVLLVEDDEDCRFLFLACLEAAGFRVVEAGVFEEALTAIEREASLVAVITDTILPGRRHGMEVGTLAKEFFPGIPILQISACSPNDLRVLHVPFPDDLMQKPIDPEDLIAELKKKITSSPPTTARY